MTQRVGAETLLKVYGVKVDPDEFRAFAGMGEANFLSGVAGKYGIQIDDIDKLKETFYGIYLEKAADPTEDIGLPGAIELVKACREAGLKVAVASSADRVKVDANLKLVGFDAEADFDAIVSADLFERLKPAPDIFLAAAREVGVEPSACVVVEDAAAGVQAARAAGMRVVGVTTTLPREEMLAQEPDEVRPAIAGINMNLLQGLQWARRAEVGAEDRTNSGRGAGLSDNGAPSLDSVVELPGGYSTTRRTALKAVALAGGLGSFYVLLTRTKAMSFASPKALLNALLPRPSPTAGVSREQTERAAAFKRFIGSVERRGGGEEVPEFPAGAQWFNAPPLKLARELRGKVVVLDFWTYCCINCMHVLPELAALERKYAGRPVAVVGVHSAKFDNEKDNEAIRNAVLRYDVSHPVVNDARMVLWRDLGVASWPTLVIVSPRGRVLATLPGEGQQQNVDDMLAAALEYYGERGMLDESPVPMTLERERRSSAASPLRYPGKLAADLAGNRLFISDSNNHRIVVCDLEGRFLDQVGGNGAALRDGAFEAAAFNRPQGVAYSARRNCLYVADTENNALREVNLQARTVRTLAGDGVKAEQDYAGGRSGRAQRLNSPWDLAFDVQEEGLYIAMAGQHQIWRHDLKTSTTSAFSGDGYERNANGASGPATSWAQPSGLSLSTDGRELWVADSESSTVRSMDLTTGGSTAHVGGDALFADNLFRFGDKDGSGTGALLQHPLAVLALPTGEVFVADSYNHKLKVLEPASDSIRSMAGSGVAGMADGAGGNARLSEPAGLCPGPNGTVLVADTNNSAIRVFNLKSGALRTLELKGVPQPTVSPDGAPADGPSASSADPVIPKGASLVASEAPITSSSASLHIQIQLPSGYHLTKGANSRFEASALGPAAQDVKFQPSTGQLKENGAEVSADVVVKLPATDGVSGVLLACKAWEGTVPIRFGEV
ncbi:g11081 [Coccomyxa elongata]